MKRTKIITLLTAFIIVAAMTGIAAAGGFVTGMVTDGGVVVDGATVKVYADAAHSEELATVVTNSDGIYTTHWIDSLAEGQQVWVTATKGDKSGANHGIAQNNGNEVFKANIAVILVSFNVPEFATIAIPAVAILGLFLFFNHRKHKKD